MTPKCLLYVHMQKVRLIINTNTDIMCLLCVYVQKVRLIIDKVHNFNFEDIFEKKVLIYSKTNGILSRTIYNQIK